MGPRIVPGGDDAYTEGTGCKRGIGVERRLKRHVLGNRGGISLQVLTILAALLPCALASVVQLQSLSHQQKFLVQKQEAQQLQNLLISTLSESNTCGCLLTAGFDGTKQSVGIPLSSIPSGCDAGLQPIQPRIIAGEDVFGTVTGLKVSKISLDNLTQTSPDQYQGTVRVSFSNPTQGTPLADVAVTRSFYTDPASPPEGKKIIRCQDSSSRILTTYADTQANVASLTSTVDLKSNGYMLLSAGMLKGKYQTISVLVDGVERAASTSDQNGGSMNGHSISLRSPLTAGAHTISVTVRDSASGTMALVAVQQLKMNYVVLSR